MMKCFAHTTTKRTRLYRCTNAKSSSLAVYTVAPRRTLHKAIKISLIRYGNFSLKSGRSTGDRGQRHPPPLPARKVPEMLSERPLETPRVLTLTPQLQSPSEPLGLVGPFLGCQFVGKNFSAGLEQILQHAPSLSSFS
jgi:hypothetical protein